MTQFPTKDLLTDQVDLDAPDAMSATDAADTRKGIQSVEVSGVIIAALCDFKFPVPLKDLAAAVDMSPAKVHRYLASLVRIGLAWQDDQTGLYGLGPMALRMGISAIERNDVVMRAGRLLRKLAIELRSSGHLAIWGERGPVLIRTEHGGPPIISTMGLGTVMPLLRSATGQAFLSAMPRSAIEHVIHAEQDILHWDDATVDRLITDTRARGAAVIEGDIVPGLSAISAPVFNLDGAVACCVTLMNPKADYFQPGHPAFDTFRTEIDAFTQSWGGDPRGED
ncbi:IclR family transcriptional regulator [Thalassospira lucentensis]|uniref:IclR family transcriptional regulator n=1 Tax=Thalassospira lucentensis TaxID=168935 RepID=A0A358HP88_9PROT|nr:IclR family transcriptional regulator [Thalassospira lucentensis]HBU96998.1 IclR family transcriptional regulator [Thalassospira lucentensis]HCW69521.1 IclR family transcriptional regulator [Thalassospira lucentensis]